MYDEEDLTVEIFFAVFNVVLCKSSFILHFTTNRSTKKITSS